MIKFYVLLLVIMLLGCVKQVSRVSTPAVPANILLDTYEAIWSCEADSAHPQRMLRKH